MLRVIAEAEVKRSENAEEFSPEVKKKVSDSISRIVEQARKLSQDPNKEDKSAPGDEAVRKEFENLLSVLTTPRGMSQESIK